MFFDQEVTVKLAFAAVGKFILIFVGSAVIGVVVGALCSLVSLLVCNDIPCLTSLLDYEENQHSRRTTPRNFAYRRKWILCLFLV